MTNRENYLAIARRQGYEYMPVHFNMCPSLQEKFRQYQETHDLFIPEGPSHVGSLPMLCASPEDFLPYYADKPLKPGANIDKWGVAHEPGSKAAFHMTYMRHPMENFDSLEQIQSYPFPVFTPEGAEQQKARTEALHAAGKAVQGALNCSLWEQAWYLRGMENLFCDMMSEDPMAEELLDRVTDVAVKQIESLAAAGVDSVYFGDDIGMQHTIMMSEELYRYWLQPRLKRVIDAAKAIKPDILIIYHSCGHINELIPNLIEAGIDILNPIQPESMEFRQIHNAYCDRLSFHGTIGTQTTMPFGTPAEVRQKVFENLDIAGKKGGLFVAPTHMLEPEVPVENVVAYIQACAEYTSR